MKKYLHQAIIALMLLLMPNFSFGQSPPTLGATSSFALFTAAGDISVVGATTITGDIGTHVGTLTGLPPGTITGNKHVLDGTATSAAADVATAYSNLFANTCGTVLGTTLGSQTLLPGVYCVGAAASIGGTLTLDGNGDPNALFIFKIDGALTPNGSSIVALINSASSCNVYWQVGGAFTLTGGAVFYGTVIANGALTIDGTLYGRALTTAGAINVTAATVALPVGVLTPVFTAGASSARCQGAGTVTYGATATGSTSISYSLDAASITGGNSIVAATGAVTYDATWAGTSIITATASGCGGPTTETHTVTTTAAVATPVFTLGATSSRCQAAGAVTYAATASNSTSITYTLDAASITAGNSIVAATGVVTYVAAWSGSSVITASAAGCTGPKTSTHTATITATVATPVFTLGTTSSRCQAAGTVTYAATASNSTSIVYSLDAASITGGNSIVAATGVVTYVAGWGGTSVITATAAGCNGPATATHTVTNTATAGIPVFTLGATSAHCQGAGTVTYGATSSNSTSITYSLDATSTTAGNSIVAATGVVTYTAAWNGTSVITALATGCSGTTTASHTVTTAVAVATPVFTLGATSTRCQAAGVVTYGSTASNSTSITYTLDATSITAGNSIVAATGAVTYLAGWNGTSVITASAAGCSGPATATHTVTITPTVGTPVFTLGATSTRCLAAGTVTYAATASNSTALTYTLDAASITGGNSIVAATGVVTYVAAWSGASVITASATGCNGPVTAIHTATVTAAVGTPVFTLGATSTRCQIASAVTYAATASSSTSITYTLDAASITAGNSIVAATGVVTYLAAWNGTSVITASAAGCNGPKTATHTVTISVAVGTPVFTLGATSTRCQAAGTVTYAATATNSSAVTYTLDATSITAGNSIVAATGVVTYLAGWNGTSVITASAAGCNGPATAIHTVTITPSVGTPVFTLGATSIRCLGAGSVTYAATASNSTALTYTLDAASITGGNSIVAATGVVTYAAAWSGTSVITANATGCNGSATAIHTVTITPTVATPIFTLGATSTRCLGAGTVTYLSTASNSTAITYSLDAASITAGNSIIAATGVVTYTAAWSGTSIITASAAGCNGPKTAIHTVTITPAVGTPVFTLGAISSRCQVAGTVTYTATASNSTGITYSLDAASIVGGNSINTATGVVTYAADWNGTTVITASAAGCNGPATAIHTATVKPAPTVTVTASGATTFCFGGSVILTASLSANYLWSTGATTQSIIVSASGDYSVTVTNGNGCSTTSVITKVVVNPIPEAPVVTIVGNTLTNSTTNITQWYYEANGSVPGAVCVCSCQAYIITRTGWYWCTVTVNGCTSPISNKVYVVITGVSDLTAETSFDIYPVPNDGSFTVSIQNPMGGTFVLEIYNMLGSKIHERTMQLTGGKSEQQIDLRPLSNGLYTVLFRNAQHKVVKKMLVNK